jgi:hypothetical protein
MQYVTVSAYGEKQFYRLTGVKRGVFDLVVEVVCCSQHAFGRPRELSVEDQILLTLCYWREYRTQFHVASSFGMSEATVCRIVRKVEGVLFKDERFHLPGKKALHNGSLDLSVIVVDASEVRIERPQKNSASSTRARKSATHSRDNS